jgi:transposase
MSELKQVVGVDVAQKELVVTLGKSGQDRSIELYQRRKFANKDTGFAAFFKWLIKNRIEGSDLLVVMEATGVYHQRFAHFLQDNEIALSVVLPNKISNYMRTLTIKTVNDQSCADAIAQFGLERKLDAWQRPDPTYELFRELTRERGQIVEERAMIKNQLHAQCAKAIPNQSIIDRMESRKQLLSLQEKEIKQEIRAHQKKHPRITEQVKLLCSIPGIGELSAVTILGETNGFELIRNKKQLTSYAGLDVKEKQSGTSVKGKPKISKKGNRHVRKAMHLPALSAIRHDERYRNLYARLVARDGIKMKAIVAVQRKLLELTFTLFKNQKSYNPMILDNNKEERQLQ